MCNKGDLYDHFNDDRHGGGEIAYILYPLGKEENKAFVCFKDSAGDYLDFH